MLGKHISEKLKADAAFRATGAKLNRQRGVMDATPPRVIYNIDTDEFLEDSLGFVGDMDSDVTFECFGIDGEEALKIVTAIFNCLVNYTGTLKGTEITEVCPSSDIEDTWSEKMNESHRTLVLRIGWKSAD